jgi:tetratricopeptide (TPR) repeat protein
MRSLPQIERLISIQTSSRGSPARCRRSSPLKRFNEAYKLSERLVAFSPDDPSILFYHAKLAHEARAFDAEIEALQRLITLGEKAGINVSGYRIYLAQAFAHRGEGDEARNQLTIALLDTSLPREQRKRADELLTHIQEQMKKLN